MRTPMPSPTGFNREQLFLPRSFPRPAGATYDEASEAPASQRAMLRRKARRFFEERWRAQWEDFCAATDLADEGEDESVHEAQHRAIEAAAHTEPELEYGMGPATEDELPEYGPNGMPRNAVKRQAMDALKHIRIEPESKPRQAPRSGEKVRQAAAEIAPGLRHIKIGA
jgi:hypothetical protein